MFLCGSGAVAQGGINRVEKSMPRGRCFRVERVTASSIWFSLYISFKLVCSHSLLLTGSCAFSLVKYIKCACAQKPQSAHAVTSLRCQTGLKEMLFVSGELSLHRNRSLNWNTRKRFSRLFERSRQNNVEPSFCFEKDLWWLGHVAALNREGIPLHNTEAQKTRKKKENKRKSIGNKTTKKDYLLIISKIPTNRQKKRKRLVTANLCTCTH